jgi:hypothetical protein
MNRHRVTLLPALALAFSLLVAAAPQGTATAADAAKSPEVKLDAPPATKGIRVAVLRVVNATGEAEADKIMEDVLRERFSEVDTKRAMFLMPADVERLLDDADALDRAWRVADRWGRTGTLDSTAVGGLDSLLIADAVLCVKVSEWETKRYHNIGEGQSYTTVGLQFALYGIRDKKKMWSKAVREQRLARELDLSSATIGYDETGRIQTAKANDPPRIAEVASDLVRDALKKFPNK